MTHERDKMITALADVFEHRPSKGTVEYATKCVDAIISAVGRTGDVAQGCVMRAALERIAKQQLVEERLVEGGDYEYGYEQIVKLARAALAAQPPAAPVETERRYTEKEVSETVEKVISGMLARGEIADTRAHSRSSAGNEGETKTVYVKRWRTLVKLPAKYAEEIVAALRIPENAQPTTDEIRRLETENWQLRQACGYPIPADKETPQNPFKCGICDARAQSDGDVTLNEPQTVVTREVIAEIIDPMSFKTIPGSEAQSRALHKADRILALSRPQSKCPRCKINTADPALLGSDEEGHICGTCWAEDRHANPRPEQS